MNKKTLHITNIPRFIGRSRVEAIFSGYGDILSLHYPVDTESGNSEGYAIITFFSPQAARRALEKDGHPMSDNVLKVEYAKDQANK